MKKSLSVWQLGGLTFTAVLGTLLHFLFDLTEKSLLVAPFSAVNESTWEHMKILFFPMLFFAVLQSVFFAKACKGFWKVKCVGITLGVALIPTLFYTYNGAFGRSPDWLNVLFFFISAGVAYFAEYMLFSRTQVCDEFTFLPIFIIFLTTLGFVVFTFYPPNIPLFQDPISSTYGI